MDAMNVGLFLRYIFVLHGFSRLKPLNMTEVENNKIYSGNKYCPELYFITSCNNFTTTKTNFCVMFEIYTNKIDGLTDDD
jgi:hypothetical protein